MLRTHLMAIIGLLGAAILGCVPQLVSVDLAVPYDEKEMAHRLAPGNNEIHSRINFRRPFGGYANCIYGLVTLVPATPYAVAWISEFYGNPEIAWPIDKSAFMEKNGSFLVIRDTEPFFAASRQTYCDSDSHFGFRNLADGDYFVMVNVLWRKWGSSATVGSLVTRFKVTGGEHLELKWPALIDLE